MQTRTHGHIKAYLKRSLDYTATAMRKEMEDNFQGLEVSLFGSCRSLLTILSLLLPGHS